MSKHKVFAWLILNDRLNTKDMMIRRHWTIAGSNDCVLCHAHTIEDMLHLFFNCLFSSKIWSYLQINWDGTSVGQCLNRAKRDFTGPCFMEIVILACWNIWKQHNGWIFKNVRPSFRAWKALFVLDISLLKFRVKPSDAHSIDSWLRSLV